MQKIWLLVTLVTLSIFSIPSYGNSNSDIDESSNQSPIETLVIARPPIYPGCDPQQLHHLISCFSHKASNFVLNKIDINIASQLGLSGKQSILVSFKVDKAGNVVDVTVKAPHPVLAKEVDRVVRLLPKMQAAIQSNGETVDTPFILPLSFVIAD